MADSREALQALIDSPDEVVPAAAIAPIVRMHPSVIVKQAKEGRWTFCKYIVSGRRVKFLRLDFLRQGGWIQ